MYLLMVGTIISRKINLLQIQSFNYPSKFWLNSEDSQNSVDIITSERTYTFVGKESQKDSIQFIRSVSSFHSVIHL